MQEINPVVIIGAGIAGLCAAIHLQKAGKKVLILEADNEVGGRVRTDQKEGFLLDRGFQVLLTAYPEARRMLNFNALDLKYFEPGALILHNGSIKRIGDPRRKLSSLIPTLFSGVAGIKDMLSILRLVSKVKQGLPEELLDQEGPTSASAFSKQFSNKFQNRFLKPFFKGIFLEDQLDTSSAMFEFTFRMFAEGYAAIPANGMAEIPRQLASQIGNDFIRLNTRVTSIQNGEILTEHGETITSEAIVLAADGWSPLLGNRKLKDNCGGKTTCLYFSSKKAPHRQSLIALKSAPVGLVNNVAVLNNTAANYAPEGKSLIAVSIIGDTVSEEDALIELTRQELTPWYGSDVIQWEHLATYHIPHSLPDQRMVRSTIPPQDISIGNNVFLAGDHLLNGSINGAMVSGRLAAEAIIQAQK